MNQEYVVGFLFDPHQEHVLLIRKNRPKWQEGRYNGIGGKVEPGESPDQAMRREFREEAGQEVEGWRVFARLEGPGYTIYFFYAMSDLIWKATTQTDEVVGLWDVQDVTSGRGQDLIPNVRWLIPMALSLLMGETAPAFRIEEVIV